MVNLIVWNKTIVRGVTPTNECPGYDTKQSDGRIGKQLLITPFFFFAFYIHHLFDNIFRFLSFSLDKIRPLSSAVCLRDQSIQVFTAFSQFKWPNERNERRNLSKADGHHDRLKINQSESFFTVESLCKLGFSAYHPS